jgi:hypothetical protein
VWKDEAVPSPLRLISRRAGPVGLALTALDVWRRLPPDQRRQIVDATRKQAPRAAAAMLKYWRGRRPPV